MGQQLQRARRERGWSQAKLIHEIEHYARRHLLTIASTASLRVYVSEWENGRRTVAPPYTGILRALLGLTDAELFDRPSPGALPAADGYDELLSRIDAAGSLSAEMVSTFQSQTELLRNVDRQMGAANLVDQMTGHLRALEDALTFAILPSTRTPIAQALAGAATLAAWQALDVGAVERAWRNYELAKRAAIEGNAPMFLAHATAEQAYVLSDAGRPELAIQLAREAQTTGRGHSSARLTAWLHAVEAELCAKAGLASEARHALDLAAQSLPAGGEARDPDMPSVFLNAGHLDRWRGNVLALLGDDDAVNSLYQALDTLDPTFVRASAGLRCDLAQAHLARQEFDQAAEHLRQARLIASRTGSVRHLKRIERLTGSL